MEEGTEECEVCGCTDFYKEAGHFYCNECQTQSQQVREQVFEQEDGPINKSSTRKIQKAKTQKSEDKLTSWECYNVILKCLTEELIGLGAKHEIKSVVRCLWMKYLHKCQVFDLKSNKPPKVSILGSKKDIDILYNVKKRKRHRTQTIATSTIVSAKRQRSTKRQALVHSQYEELSQSQNLKQDSSMLGETLSNLKTGLEKPGSSTQIEYNSYSNAQLKRIMSGKHQKRHKRDLGRELRCHNLGARSFPGAFVSGPTVLTSFTLYSILYIGLLIVEDSLQLGDMLRFIREGHLSFGSYRHFFDEDTADNSLNLPRRGEKLFTSQIFRQRTAALVHFLQVETYIKRPNLVQLCSRYCTELNLPRQVVGCVEKLLVKTAPQMQFTTPSKEIPNYEGRAMSFILFTLKLLFSLDGATENKLSDYAGKLNRVVTDAKMFDFREWLKYIGYRDTVVTTYHMPSSLENCDNIDSEMYLNYIKTQEIKFKGTGKRIQNEVQDYLQIFEKLLDDVPADGEIKFQHSLTPFLSYVKVIWDTEDIACENVLRRTFSDDSLDFLLKPNEYLKLLGTDTVRNGGANDNIVIEEPLYLDKNINDQKNKEKNPVTVRVSDGHQGDRFIQECLDSGKRASLKPTDVDVFLSNWQDAHVKQFSMNQALLKLVSEQVTVNSVGATCNTELYTDHYNPFERYWLNIPFNPTNVRLSVTKSKMQPIMSKLSSSYKIILREFRRIVEQDFHDFWSEFLVTELNLVYFVGGYCSQDKTGKVPGINKVLNDCRKKW